MGVSKILPGGILEGKIITLQLSLRGKKPRKIQALAHHRCYLQCLDVFSLKRKSDHLPMI